MIEKNDPRLTAYLLDELDPQEASAVEAAIDQSPELQEHVEGLRSMIGVLNRSLDGGVSDHTTMTPAQLQQIEAAATGRGEVTPTIASGDTGRILWRNFAIAALVLYAVGISVFAFRDPATTRDVKEMAAHVEAEVEPPPAENGLRVETIQVADAIRDGNAQLTPAAEDSGVAVTNQARQSGPQPVDESEVYYDVDGFASNTQDHPALSMSMRSGEEDREELLREFALTDDSGDMTQEMGMSGRGMGSAGMGMGDPRPPLSSPRFLNFDVESLRSDAPVTPRIIIGEEQEALAIHDRRVRDTDHDEDLVSDTPIEVVPESEAIILRGGKRDVERVAELIENIEAENKESGEQPVEQRLAVGGPEPSNSIGRDGEEDGAEATDDSKKIAAIRLRTKVEEQKRKHWKPASAATNRARLSVGHRDDLELAARDTYVRIDGFRARVFFDCYYYNDRPQQLEGQFMLRLPNDASLHYFAFGPTTLTTPTAPVPTGKPGEAVQAQDSAAAHAVWSLRQETAAGGSDLARRAGDSDYAAEQNSTFALVKAARVAPRQKAAMAYDETVRRRVDPALVEWAGPGIFQTRVFPLLPHKLHRIIIGYDVMLSDDGDDRLYSLQLPEGEAGGRVEFDIAASAGTEATISPETEAFVSGGRAYYRFLDAEPTDYTVRLSGSESVVLNTRGVAGEEYFATRLIANLPDEAAKADARQAIFLLDTSWSDRSAAFSRRLRLIEQVLKQNRDSIEQFAVLLFNVEQRWWRTEFVANDAANVNAFLEDAGQLALEGATDLHGALTEATEPAWAAEREESLPQPNFFLLSDASATWGKTDLASLADPLSQLDRSTGGGALFAYHLAGHRSDKATLQWLAEASGGAVFDVAEEAELSAVAIAHRSRPWQIVKATARGADEILIQGVSKTVYPNQPLVIGGRGKLNGPVRISLRRGKEKQTLEFEPRLTIASPAAARLYGQLAVQRLEPYAENLEEVTVAFARYFRVPGRTCSMVMLEGPEDYERLGVNVPPAEDRLVIASTSVAAAIEEQESELLDRRENPRKRFLAWVDSLESASLLKVSTALRLAMKRLPDTAFRFDAKPLECRSWKTDQFSRGFMNELNQDAPGFDAVMDEAQQRLIAFGADDAIKTASTLVEAKPSDVDTLRSVAFRAIEWQRSDQAAPLLWRLTQARPYQPQCLLLLARAMSESGDVDSAIVCYDLVSSGNWNARWSGAKDIAAVELLHVLEQVDSGAVESGIPHYARARLTQLRDRWGDEGLDLAVVMHWNTDRTDVDLHVTEPSGEECFYSHNRTKSGGQLTQDITEGLGPEMYSLETAPNGKYRVEAKYYSSDANRTKAPTETLLTVFRNVGRSNTKVQTKRITLRGTGEKQLVQHVTVEP